MPWLCNAAPSSARYCSISCDFTPDYLLRSYYSIPCFRQEDPPTDLYKEAVANALVVATGEIRSKKRSNDSLTRSLMTEIVLEERISPALFLKTILLGDCSRD